MYSPAYVAGVYLIKFLLRNLSYSPCSEPSRTQCIPATRLNAIHPPLPLYLYLIYGSNVPCCFEEVEGVIHYI